MLNIKQKLMYLLGSNISHSKSPELYNNYFKKNGIDMKYGLYDTLDIKAFVKKAKSIPIFGFNVTMPYKMDIIEYLDEIDDIVKNSISCNLVKIVDGKLIGYNTDGIGFFESIKSTKYNIMTIIGHGGAGRAIEAASKKYGIYKCNIITHKMSNDSLNDINTYHKILNMLLESDLIVNASNVGFGDNNNIPLSEKILNDLVSVKKDFTYIDIIYNPSETQLMKYFKTNGIKKVYNGEEMLKCQFNENIKILFKN